MVLRRCETSASSADDCASKCRLLDGKVNWFTFLHTQLKARYWQSNIAFTISIINIDRLRFNLGEETLSGVESRAIAKSP